jgi:4-phytase/acid phosphatase
MRDSRGHATGEACAAGGTDTNLANLADVLDVDWHDARQADDHPSGGALVFDLWRKHGRPIVRVSSMTSTLDALRHAGFHSDDALVQKTLALPPWTSHAPARHRERVARHAA